MTQQVNDRVTLVLASVAKKVQHSRPEWATNVVRRLEQRIGVHGVYTNHQNVFTLKIKTVYCYCFNFNNYDNTIVVFV